MKKKIITIWIIFFFCISSFHISAAYNQRESFTSNNAEIKSITVEQPYEGYSLFSPEYGKNAYLINNIGEIVHMWNSDHIQGLATYLLEDGSLLRACSPGLNPIFHFGGFTGRIERYDWDGNRIWEYTYLNNSVCLHHDICPLPNGNILMIAWEYKSADEILAAGRNPDLMPWKYMCFDHIIEVKPTGDTTGEIVWEWHLWDHLIQEYDQTKMNYGSVKEHPELIDINYQITDALWNIDVWNQDYFHMNSIDYNEQLDQILVSVRNYNEIWVIDHSTSTMEAEGHTGGRYGKGGDLLYRWGNPETFKQGESIDKTLFFQHDAQWIDAGLLGEDHILIFNNGIQRPDAIYSSIDEIIPPVNETGHYMLSNEGVFGPESVVWQYTDEYITRFFSIHLSSAQRLPNGNTLICDGDDGFFFEVTSDNEIVWSYQNPYPLAFQKDVFKVRKYALDYPGIGDFSNIGPNPPEKPSGDTFIEKDMIYKYKTSSFDANGDSLYYLFDWDDESASEWIGPYNPGEEISIQHTWTHEGLYEVRVQAKDIHEVISDWSAPLNVIVQPVEAWLFGSVEHIDDMFNEITIQTNSLFVFCPINSKWQWYTAGVEVSIQKEYTGVLTQNVIAGKFFLKNI